MSPDPVLAAIDDTLEAVRQVTCACGCERPIGPRSKSMYYAGEACQHRWMGRGRPSTATGPGWVRISPPGTRYETEPGEWFDTLLNLPPGSLTIEFDTRPLDPFGGPVPCPYPPGAAPHLHQDAPAPSNVTAGNDVQRHRAAHPMRVFWDALAKRVRR